MDEIVVAMAVVTYITSLILMVVGGYALIKDAIKEGADLSTLVLGLVCLVLLIAGMNGVLLGIRWIWGVF